MTLRHLLPVVCLLFLAAPARADDWDDCRSDVPDRLIAGCTGVIQKAERPANDLAVAHRRRAIWYGRRGMLDRAMEDVEAVVRLMPNSAEALADRALAHRQRGNLDGALADSEKAIELDPNSAVAHYQRGLVRQSKGENERAMADFDRSIALRPDFPGPYASRATAG